MTNSNCDDWAQVTATAPVNMAVIKYWGKRDEKLILPINSSISATLNQDELRATTTVFSSKSLTCDRIWLNGREEDITAARLQNCLREIRRCAGTQARLANSELKHAHVHIVSVNNFPTAAGLASSAAGFACLVFALARLYELPHSPSELSAIARVGSGSACRSVLGGFVKWQMGYRADGLDSTAVQLVPEDHWPELQILVLVVSDQKKDTSSTAGMETSVNTSFLLKKRAAYVEEQRIAEMENAIRARNFHDFSTITMQDSNQFHACCLDTFPPIMYLNDVSRAVITLVTRYNALFSENRVAYTFDAGPNAVLFVRQQHVAALLPLLLAVFPPSNLAQFVPSSLRDVSGELPHAEHLAALAMRPLPHDSLKSLLHTSVGPGPRVLPQAECLVHTQSGLPLLTVAA